MRRNSRNPTRAVARLPRRNCCKERSYIRSGPGPAGFPEGPTGGAMPPGVPVSSGGTGCWARSSMRARSSLRRCWLWPVSSCTWTSCCCTATRSVFMSPRICTRYACCADRVCCRAANSGRSESRRAACSAAALPCSDRRACTWSSTFRTSPFRAHPAASPRLRTKGDARGDTYAPGSRLAQRLAAGDDLELVAAVLRPRRLVVPRRERPLLTVGHGLDATPVDAVTHEILLRGRGASVAEGQVVFVRPALVAVARDANPQIGVRLQDRDLLVEDGGVLGAEVCLVEVEMDHRGEQGAHRVCAAPEGGKRVGFTLTPIPLGLVHRPRDRVLPRPLDRISPRLFGRGGRVRVRLRGRGLGLGAAATGGDARNGKAAEHEPCEPFHRCALSGFKGWKRGPPGCVETRLATARRSAAATNGSGPFQRQQSRAVATPRGPIRRPDAGCRAPRLGPHSVPRR